MKIADPDAVGQLIERYRHRAGLTQIGLAEAARVGRSTVERYEQGGANKRAGRPLQRLVDHLGIPEDELREAAAGLSEPTVRAILGRLSVEERAQVLRAVEKLPKRDRESVQRYIRTSFGPDA